MISHINTLSWYAHKLHVFKNIPTFMEIYFSKFNG